MKKFVIVLLCLCAAALFACAIYTGVSGCDFNKSPANTESGDWTGNY